MAENHRNANLKVTVPSLNSQNSTLRKRRGKKGTDSKLGLLEEHCLAAGLSVHLPGIA